MGNHFERTYYGYMELEKEKWSRSLMEIRPKMKSLFYKGDIDLLLEEVPKLAVVGSRRMTDYGHRVIEKWVPTLVQKGVVVVSGFMYGVDQTAHKACLDNGGKTIAVLGMGIDVKPGSQDQKLYQKILELDSLIVSEYSGDFPASRATFPERNRIVAGISDAVLVVEAAEKSGSLITARLARKFGKPLLAIPGLITNKVAEGSNNLIKNGKAVMVTSAEDILAEMGLTRGQIKIKFGEMRQVEPILEVLERGEKDADELARVLKISIPNLMEKIFELQMEGLVEEKSGKYHLL